MRIKFNGNTTLGIVVGCWFVGALGYLLSEIFHQTPHIFAVGLVVFIICVGIFLFE